MLLFVAPPRQNERDSYLFSGPAAAGSDLAYELRDEHDAEASVVVPVVRVVPVAIGAAHVLCIIVERAPTKHATANELTLFRTRDLRTETCGDFLPDFLP